MRELELLQEISNGGKKVAPLYVQASDIETRALEVKGRSKIRPEVGRKPIRESQVNGIPVLISRSSGSLAESIQIP